jgi:hypothetical protein
MSETNRFFRFPIGLLSYDPTNPAQTLSMIVDWCIGNVAESTFEGWDLDSLKEEISRRGAGHGTAYSKTAKCCRLVLAADTLGVSYGSLTNLDAPLHAAYRFLDTVASAARNNTVQVKTEWLWDCHKTVLAQTPERSLTFREFRVLCALLSKIGAKGVKKCSWREVQARAAGFCGKSDMANCSPDWTARVAPLIHTRGEIRITLSRLEVNDFFARYNHGWRGKARESWFSFSMPRDELRSLVLSRKLKAKERYEELRAQDQKAAASRKPSINQPTANINSERAESPVSTANINSATKSDQPVANVPTNRVTNVLANAIANINENNPNENDGNANDFNSEQKVTTIPVSFSDEEKRRWPEFATLQNFEGAPFEYCSSIHQKFREWLDAALCA